MLYGIPRVLVGENVTFLGAEMHLRARGAELEALSLPERIEIMTAFQQSRADLWDEDIGE